jgi:hypothetical protein
MVRMLAFKSYSKVIGFSFLSLRHCERSEAIQRTAGKAGLLRRKGFSQ